MDNIILRIADVLITTGLSYTGLCLFVRYTQKTHCSRLLLLLVALVVGISRNAITGLPISIAYIISFFLIFLILCLLFRINITINLHATLAVINITMCLRIIFASITALIQGIYIHDVFAVNFYSIIVSALSDFVCLFLFIFLYRHVSTSKLIAAIGSTAKTPFISWWTLMLTVLTLSNAILLEIEVPHRSFTALEGIYCLSLLLCGLSMLFFSFKISSRASNLNSELLAQSRLQSALVRDALFVAQADITTNCIIDGLGVYSENLSSETISYDQWLEFARTKVHPDDYDVFYNSVNRKNLLTCFALGSEPDPFLYRRYCDDGEYRWVKVSTRLYRDINTNDIHIVGYALDVDADMREKAALEKLAQTDSLTKLLNRAAAEKAIAAEIENGHGALFLMDIDDFKDINDCMGHDVGDRVLINVANRLMSFFGDDNIVGRLGGDEFLAYLKDTTDIDALHEKAAALVKLLSSPPSTPGEPTVTLSLGIAPVREPNLSFTSVYSQADIALYEKKYNGKQGYLIFGDK